jgi:hypothetical protein
MAIALAIDGFRLDGFRPRVISTDDVRDADLVVAIDTELPQAARTGASSTEVWTGFPPMREKLLRLARGAQSQRRSSGRTSGGPSEHPIGRRVP